MRKEIISSLSVMNKGITGQMTKTAADQVANNAGGFVYAVTPKTRLDRFLMLGIDSNSIYLSRRQSSKDNIGFVTSLIKDHNMAQYAVERATELSNTGRISNNDYALILFAIAMAHGDNATKELVSKNFNKVCRTGTHMLHMASFLDGNRGWGPRVRRLFKNWFLEKKPEQVAFQFLKYKSRDGWAQRDVIRLSHPKTADPVMNATLGYIVNGKTNEHTPKMIIENDKMMAEPNLPSILNGINLHGFTREMIPTEYLNNRSVWEALLMKMGPEAIIRNVNKMTNLGLFNNESNVTFLRNKLTNKDELTRSRLHPMKVLLAYRIYGSGRGQLGDLSWTPNAAVTKILEECFYASFVSVLPTDQAYMCGIDISGSMQSSKVMGTPMSARDAALALAMVTRKVETNVRTFAFDADVGQGGATSNSMREIIVEPDASINDLLTVGGKWMGGRTDCALPMLCAMKEKIYVDNFIIYTDNETWAGHIKPYDALLQYRKQFNPKAKLIVVAFTSTGFTIANPNDAGMMDIVGFDPNIPSLIENFVTGF